MNIENSTLKFHSKTRGQGGRNRGPGSGNPLRLTSRSRSKVKVITAAGGHVGPKSCHPTNNIPEEQNIHQRHRETLKAHMTAHARTHENRGAFGRLNNCLTSKEYSVLYSSKQWTVAATDLLHIKYFLYECVFDHFLKLQVVKRKEQEPAIKICGICQGEVGEGV